MSGHSTIVMCVDPITPTMNVLCRSSSGLSQHDLSERDNEALSGLIIGVSILGHQRGELSLPYSFPALSVSTFANVWSSDARRASVAASCGLRSRAAASVFWASC